MATKRLKFVGAMPVDANQVEESFGEVFTFPPTAAGTDYEIPIGFADGPNIQRLLNVNLILSAAVNKSTSVYDTITLMNRKTGSGTDALAAIDSNASSGTLAANTRLAFTIDQTKAITRGDLLSIVLTHASTGTALPGFAVEVKRRQ
jgi:hypothetical protein